MHMHIMNDFFVVKLNTFPHFLNFRITWHNHSHFPFFFEDFSTFASGKATFFYFSSFFTGFLLRQLSWNVFISLTTQSLDDPGLNALQPLFFLTLTLSIADLIQLHDL